MPSAASNQTQRPGPDRKKIIVILTIIGLPLFAVLFSLSSFQMRFIDPKTSGQTVSLVALTLLVSLLFGGLTFVLLRNLIKVFAERRLGVLGSKFRTRLVVGSLLLSFVPVIVMFWFSYGLMNRSIERWFSTPVEEVQTDTAIMADLLSRYASENARAEAATIASAADTQHAFAGHSFSGVLDQFRAHQASLQHGFAVAIQNGESEASFGLPAPWAILKGQIQATMSSDPDRPQILHWQGTEYILGRAIVENQGEIVVGMPLPAKFAQTQQQLEASQQQYLQLAHERRQVRLTYMAILMALTGLVLFVSMWLALYLSRFVTRPVAALAEATHEISRGNLDHRVEIPAADEFGDLVRSFNRMAEELKSNRQQIEISSRELSIANAELDQRRRQMETILESIPTGVLSLDASLRVTHVNRALLRLLRPSGNGELPTLLLGASLQELFTPEVVSDVLHFLRRADRMSTAKAQMELALGRGTANVAITVASLQHNSERNGYVLVFEDLSDLLHAQKQAAWREVARRVAHEIKNPLTPIALSAERILRHLDRTSQPDSASLDVVRNCATVIESSVETVRTLVNEFATLARFPSSQPAPADINAVAEAALMMFNGRLEGIQLRTSFSANLPRVMADMDAIKRAIANLVDNAAEAVQTSVLKEIELSTSLVASRDAIEVCVADSGPGVNQEAKERLFLPYFSTKRRGTGLGLAIVSRIVEEHHGTIRVEENRPVGTRFVIELPLATAVAPAVASYV